MDLSNRLANRLVPDFLSSDQQFYRYYHFDLSGLDDSELLDELHFIQPRLFRLPSGHWLRARARVLEAELLKRRGNARPEFIGRPKPKLAEGVKL